MSEISRYIPGPYNGVSQVPPQVRLEGTCEAMDDCIAIIPNGLQKRPPMKYLAKLLSAGATLNPKVHMIPTGTNATDVFVVMENVGGVVTPRLFKVDDGTPVTCTVSAAAQTYLNLNNPSPIADFYLKTVEDVTFITNRTATVADKGDTVAARPYEAILWVKTGAYGRTFSVTVTPSGGGGVSCSYQPGPGGAADDALGVGTDRIADGLFSGTVVTGSGATFTGTPLNSLSGVTVTIDGSLIYLSSSSDFDITVSDDQGGTALAAIKDSVQRFSDLPAVAHDGFTVRIAQEAAGANSDYYVKFEPKGASSQGIWSETIAPGSPYGLDPATMPVAIKNTVGVWSCEALPWGRRITGTAALSPDPDFVGEKIQAVAWWRGRLALVYFGGQYLSASDDPYKFYTSTLTTALDSDPIGLLTPADQKTFFRDIAVFDRQLVGFADQVQTLSGANGGVPKPGGVMIEQVGDNEFSGASPVQSAGKKLYFTVEDTNYTHVFEMATDRLSGLPVAEDMTVSIPTYLPKGLNIAATRKKDFLTIRGQVGTSVLYLHTFRHAKQEQVQNAWCTWNMPTGYTVVGLFFRGPQLYVVARLTSSGALYVFMMDVTPGRSDTGGRILTYLDCRLQSSLASPVYSGGVTTFTLPYPVLATTIASVRGTQPDGSPYPEAYTPSVTARGAFTISLAGDWTAIPLWFGHTYGSSLVPSEWFNFGQDQKPILMGDLALHELRLDLAVFSNVSVDVRIRSRTTVTKVVNALEGLYQDDIDTLIDQAPVTPTRRVVIPLGGDSRSLSVRIYSDSHLGFSLVGYEWVGDWNQRGVRRAS